MFVFSCNICVTSVISVFSIQAVEKITSYCKELEESNLHTAPLAFCLSCALDAKKTGTCFEHAHICYDLHKSVCLYVMSSCLLLRECLF